MALTPGWGSSASWRASGWWAATRGASRGSPAWRRACERRQRTNVRVGSEGIGARVTKKELDEYLVEGGLGREHRQERHLQEEDHGAEDRRLHREALPRLGAGFGSSSRAGRATLEPRRSLRELGAGSGLLLLYMHMYM